MKVLIQGKLISNTFIHLRIALSDQVAFKYHFDTYLCFILVNIVFIFSLKILHSAFFKFLACYISTEALLYLT